MAEIHPEYLSFLINEIDNPIVITNSNFEIEWVSQSFVKTYGYTKEEFVRRRGASILKSSFNSSIGDIIQKAIKLKTSVKYESPNITKDGKELWISSTIKPVFDEFDNLQKIIIIDLDVNEKKELEERVELADSILDRLVSLILVANVKGEIVYCSPSVAKAIGFATKDLLGMGWWKLSRNREYLSEKEKDHISKSALGIIPVDEEPYERAIVCKDGSTKWILWKDTKGPDDLIIGVGHDITDRKKTEELLQVQNKEITDGIRYARGIQNVIFPTSDILQKAIPESFVLFKPKDIVSGDFYWYSKFSAKNDVVINKKRTAKFEEESSSFIIAAGDCTGHGVPGALMSIVSMSLLKQLVYDKSNNDPGKILSKLNKMMKDFLKQTSETSKNMDGMDIGLLTIYSLPDIHSSKKRISALYSGANRPLYLYRNKKLYTYNGNKTAIGGITDLNYEFISHKIDIEQGDVIYLFTDGYADQFGGPNGKKFLVKRLKELMDFTHTKTIDEQEKIYLEMFEKWRGKCDQVDDILLIGLKF